MTEKNEGAAIDMVHSSIIKKINDMSQRDQWTRS